MKKESKELGGEGGRGILSILAFSHDNLHCPEETLTFSNASKYFYSLFLYKQLQIGLSLKSCLIFLIFLGSKLLSSCLGFKVFAEKKMKTRRELNKHDKRRILR